MANKWITDTKWRDIRFQDLPTWIKPKVKELNQHKLIGKSFEYRREPTTGCYQRRLRRAADTSELHRKGVTHQKLGEHEKAITCFEEAIRINEMDHSAWHRKGISLNALGKYEDAIGCFERAIHINPRDKFAWNHRALSLCKLGKYKYANYSCNEAIKIDDTYPFAWCNRAVISVHLKDFDEFENSYRMACKLDPKRLNNQFFAENIPTIDIKELSDTSNSKGNRSKYYYLAELCLIQLRIDDTTGFLKHATDLRNMVTEEFKKLLNPIIDEIEFRRKENISVSEDLVERASIVLHEAWG